MSDPEWEYAKELMKKRLIAISEKAKDAVTALESDNQRDLEARVADLEGMVNDVAEQVLGDDRLPF